MTRYDRRASLWIGAALMAGATLQAWTHRFLIHPDGLSYIDMAAAYARGDFSTAINASWSPLLAWMYTPLIAAGLPRSLEPAVFHLLNLPILLFTYATFHYLVRLSIADSWARAAALVVFAWTQLHLMPLWIIGGDRLAAGFLFLALALLLRHAEGERAYRSAVLMGAAFGFAYLAKAVMLPLAVVTLPLLLLRRAHRSFMVACTAMILVVTPWIVTLSRAEGRFTYSGVGRLAYAWDVNEIPRMYYQGDALRGDSLPHPPRILVHSPRVYEFGTPLNVTYPIHYDPSYWYEGVRTVRDLPRHFTVLRTNVGDVIDITDFLLLGLLALWVIARRRRVGRVTWLLLWPAAAGIGSYCLLHVEPRYVAPFVAIAAVALLAPLELDRSRRNLLVAVAATTLLLAGPVARLGLDALSLTGYDRRWVPYQRNPEVVRGLRQAGIGAGDAIATIGYDFFAHNARVVGARVIAEMDRADSRRFWQLDEPTRQHVYARMRTVGIDGIVAARGSAPGWQPLGASGLHIYRME